MTSSPILPAVSTAVDVMGEDKENQAPREVIDLTGDSDGEEEVPDHAEDSGRLIPIENGENVWPIPIAAAMRGVDDLVYNPEGDGLLLRGEEVTVESSSSDESSEESEGDAE